MNRRMSVMGVAVAAVVLGSGLLVAAKDKGASEEQERKVSEQEVPAAALAALRALAGGATIEEFEEEIEHGQKYYEGSWKGTEGKVDALVTEHGDVVEIEETVTAETLKVVAPAGVMSTLDDEEFQRCSPHLYRLVGLYREGKPVPPALKRKVREESKRFAGGPVSA